MTEKRFEHLLLDFSLNMFISIPCLDLERALRCDYARMREMIIGDVPEIDVFLSKIEALENEIIVGVEET